MTGLDFKRLLEHEIEMPGLDHEMTWPVVQAFLEHCGQFSAEQGDLQIATDESLKELRDTGSMSLFLDRMYAGKSVRYALTELLRRPRILKRAFRQTWLSWQKVRGEVSIDDLLVFSVMQAISSDAITFIRDEWHWLVGQKQEQNEQARQRPKATWDTRIADCSASEKEGLWLLVELLFPQSRDPVGQSKAQGIDKDRYWGRVVNGRIGPQEIRDQRVLLDIVAWKDGNRRAVIEGLLGDRAYTSVLEMLCETPMRTGTGLAREEILAMASDLFGEILRLFAADAHAESAPGFIALWRAIDSNLWPDYEAWLWSELEKAMPISLRFAIELEYYWGSVKYTPFNQSSREEFRRRVASWAESHLTPARMCDLLTAEAQHTLRHYVLGPPEDAEVPPPDWGNWQWLGDRLIEAIQRCPLLMIPQVALLLSGPTAWRREEPLPGEEGGPRMEAVYSVGKEVVRGLFPTVQRRWVLAQAMTPRAAELAEQWPAETSNAVMQVLRDMQSWYEEGMD